MYRWDGIQVPLGEIPTTIGVSQGSSSVTD